MYLEVQKMVKAADTNFVVIMIQMLFKDFSIHNINWKVGMDR